jgi:hypothetical protein
MDFIERIFGMAPDGGTGSLEVLFLSLTVGVLVTALAWWRRSQNR